MEELDENIIQLIFKYCNRTLNEYEYLQLKDWIREDDANQRVLAEYLIIFRKINRLKFAQNFDSEVSWKLIQEKKEKESQSLTIPLRQKKTIFKRFSLIAKIAAVLVILILIPIALGELGEDNNGNGFVHTVRGNDLVTVFYLPDSSKVYLSRGSEISYNKDFNITNREVTIKGKAYIEVAELSSWPMIVKAQGYITKVRSGKLSVDTDLEKVQLALAKGVVAMLDTAKVLSIMPPIPLTPPKEYQEVPLEQRQEEVVLQEGESVTISKDSLSKKMLTDECEALAWKDKVFCFRDLDKWELAFEIAKWYGTRVEFKGNTNSKKRYSGSFDDPSVNELIKGIFESEVGEVIVTEHKITVIFI